jgi:6-pyruvoyltetrahydropterin/6-carboxytetrahydropterin synthase
MPCLGSGAAENSFFTNTPLLQALPHSITQATLFHALPNNFLAPDFPRPVLMSILILPLLHFVYYVGAMFSARVTDTFSAAHRLAGYEGDCERLHGHNYKVEVVVQSRKLDTMGIVMDFRVLKNLLKEVLSDMDHQYLNELPAFTEKNPSAENIAQYIFTSLSKKIGAPVELAKVVVWENDSCCVSYSKQG